MPLDPPTATGLDSLVHDKTSGAVSTPEFCRRVLALATRENARDLLAHLPDSDRGEFEWWFVAHFGDRIPRPVFHIRGWNGTTRDPPDRDGARDALHRAILDRREPT